MIVACANVGTLISAPTATRDTEIAMRYALGATRGRIVTQLFVEALVLASVAAIVGLAAADWALKVGFAAYLSGQGAGTTMGPDWRQNKEGHGIRWDPFSSEVSHRSPDSQRRYSRLPCFAPCWLGRRACASRPCQPL